MEENFQKQEKTQKETLKAENCPSKSPKSKKKPKYKSLNHKSWGIDFNKNEYREIVLSNSNHPEIM